MGLVAKLGAGDSDRFKGMGTDNSGAIAHVKEGKVLLLSISRPRAVFSADRGNGSMMR